MENAGGGVDGVGHRTTRGGDEIRRTPIVRVDDADGAVGKDLEQPPLGDEIRLHAAVKVEVIAGQIRENRAGEAHVVHAMERERVR